MLDILSLNVLLGDAQWETFNTIGHTFDLMLFWKHTVMTIYPEHIKVST